ncbi:MAG: glycoside hydrolase family 28 protein [Candidatus Acidiferrum sp.]
MKTGAPRRDFLMLAGASICTVANGAFASEPGVQTREAGGATAPLDFNVRSYGAVGDGKTIDTPAINKAIAAAAQVGGGRVVFPSGVYASFSIHLMSKVHIYLSQGATILAADPPDSALTIGYDVPEPNPAGKDYQDFGHCHWHNSLIWGEDLSDLSITGPGLIWGKGLSKGYGPGPKAEQSGVGNKAIALKNCRNVTFRDFSILKGGHFGFLLTGVDNVTIDNIKIDTDRDGIDIDCCRNVRVSNCTVNSPWDDGICPKSSFALGYARSTDNVTITNCLVTGIYELGSVLDGTFKKFDPGFRVPRTGRIKFGTESNGGFRNITVSNCVFEGCQGLALETVDGGLLEDIAISNITMRDITSAPIFMRLGARLRGPQGTKVGTLRRVLINNLVCYNSASKLSSIISGVPGYQIEDIKLSNIYVQHQGGAAADAGAVQPPEFENRYPEPGMFGPMPAHGFFFRHARNIELTNVEVKPMNADSRPAIVLQDVQRADFINVEVPHDARQNAYSFRDSSNVRILQSRFLPDTYLKDSIAKKDL